MNDSTTAVGCTPEKSNVFTAEWTTGNAFEVVATSTTKVTFRLYDVDTAIDDYIEGFYVEGPGFIDFARDYGMEGKATSSSLVTWDILVGPK